MGQGHSLPYVTVLFVLGSLLHVRGAVAQRVERWTCDQQVVGLSPTRGKAE